MAKVSPHLDALDRLLPAREVILGDLGPSELLGEFAALDDQPRSATLEATTPCRLPEFPAAAFRAASLALPETAISMSQPTPAPPSAGH